MNTGASLEAWRPSVGRGKSPEPPLLLHLRLHASALRDSSDPERDVSLGTTNFVSISTMGATHVYHAYSTSPHSADVKNKSMSNIYEITTVGMRV